MKLAMVAVMMAIGAYNRFCSVPRLVMCWTADNAQWDEASSRFLWILRADSIVFLGVLVAAVILRMQTPPVHATG